MERLSGEFVFLVCCVVPTAIALVGLTANLIYRQNFSRKPKIIGRPIGDKTGPSWDLSQSLSGPTVKTPTDVTISVPIEPGGMVEAGLDLGGQVTNWTIDLSDRQN